VSLRLSTACGDRPWARANLLLTLRWPWFLWSDIASLVSCWTALERTPFHERQGHGRCRTSTRSSPARVPVGMADGRARCRGTVTTA